MDTQPDPKPVQLQLGHICIRTETRCGAHTFPCPLQGQSQQQAMEAT